LKDEINRLKSSLEKTQGELEDLEGEFENLEPTYKQNAADYIKLLQGTVAALSEQLAAAERIRSKGMK
jgi:predicted nuclease with TOPRIM domain